MEMRVKTGYFSRFSIFGIPHFHLQPKFVTTRNFAHINANLHMYGLVALAIGGICTLRTFRMRCCSLCSCLLVRAYVISLASFGVFLFAYCFHCWLLKFVVIFLFAYCFHCWLLKFLVIFLFYYCFHYWLLSLLLFCCCLSLLFC